jgi:20S proteasome alpha/beta subunit
MNKNEAIKAASKFLQRIYHDDSGVPNEAVIAVINAEADGNVDAMWDALDGVIDFCKDLKEAMKETK